MANKILLEIDFQGSNAIKQAAELTKQIEKLRVEQKVLDENLRTGNVSIKQAETGQALLNAELKEAQREYRTVTKFIDDTNRATKAQEGSLESNRAKLSQLTAEYIKAGNPTRQQTKDIKDLSNKLKEQESAIGDTRRNVGNYAESLKGIGGSAGGAIDGISGFNTALKANPIGAIVGLIVPLINYLQKLEPVTEFLSAAFAGLNAAFGALFGSIGKFLSGDFAGAFAGFGDKVANAAKESYNLSRASEALKDAQRDSELQLSKNETQIDRLILQSKNRTISEQERIKFLEQASDLEEGNLKIEIKNAEESLRIQKTKNEIELRNNKVVSDENLQLEVDAQKKIEELSRNSIVLQEKIQNRKDALMDADEKKKEAAEAKETVRREKAKVEKEKALAAEVKDLEDRKKLAEKGAKEFDDLRKKALAEAQKMLDISTAEQVLKEKEKLANGLQTEKEYQAEVARIKFEALNKQLEDLQNSGDNTTEMQLAIQAKQLEIATTTVDAKIESNKNISESDKQLAQQEQELTQLKLDLAGTFVSGIKGMLGQDEANRKAYGAAIKALAIAEIGINLAKQLSAIWAVSAANPANALTAGAVGIVQGTIQAAIAIANAGFATASVTSQKLEQGGGVKALNIEGKPHSAGGEDVYVGGRRVANIEGGENMYILKRTASQYINGLSGINQAFGGDSFGTSRNYLANGGNVVVGDGGFNSRASSQNVDGQMQAQNIINAFANMPAPILKVSDLNRVQEGINAAVSVSDL